MTTAQATPAARDAPALALEPPGWLPDQPDEIKGDVSDDTGRCHEDDHARFGDAGELTVTEFPAPRVDDVVRDLYLLLLVPLNSRMDIPSSCRGRASRAC